MDRRTVFAKRLDTESQATETMVGGDPYAIDPGELLRKQDSSTGPISPTSAPTFLKVVRLSHSPSRSLSLKPVAAKTLHRSSLCPNKMLHASLIPALKQRIVSRGGARKQCKVRSDRSCGTEDSPPSRSDYYGQGKAGEAETARERGRKGLVRYRAPQALYGKTGLKPSRSPSFLPSHLSFPHTGDRLNLASLRSNRSGVWPSEPRNRLKIEALSRVSL